MKERVITLLTSKRFVLILAGGSGLALLILMALMAPYSQPALAVSLFLVLALLFIFGLATLMIRMAKLTPLSPVLTLVEAAGLSLLAWGVLVFRVFGILTWWNLLLIILASLIFEAYLRIDDATS